MMKFAVEWTPTTFRLDGTPRERFLVGAQLWSGATFDRIGGTMKEKFRKVSRSQTLWHLGFVLRGNLLGVSSNASIAKGAIRFSLATSTVWVLLANSPPPIEKAVRSAPFEVGEADAQIPIFSLHPRSPATSADRCLAG